MPDAFNPANLTDEKIEQYLKQLAKLKEVYFSNTSGNGLDESLTVLSFNTVNVFDYYPDDSKILGLISIKDNNDTDEYAFVSKLNAYLKFVATEMLKNNNWVKLFGMNFKEVFNLPFSQFKTLVKILDKHNKDVEAITRSKENELEKENEKLKTMIQQLVDRTKGGNQ